jgi:hypothetical protein
VPVKGNQPLLFHRGPTFHNVGEARAASADAADGSNRADSLRAASARRL